MIERTINDGDKNILLVKYTVIKPDGTSQSASQIYHRIKEEESDDEESCDSADNSFDEIGFMH